MRVLTSHHVLKFLSHGDYFLPIAVLNATDFFLMRFYQVLHIVLMSGHGLKNAFLDCIVPSLLVILLHSIDLDNILILLEIILLLIGDLYL